MGEDRRAFHRSDCHSVVGGLQTDLKTIGLAHAFTAFEYFRRRRGKTPRSPPAETASPAPAPGSRLQFFWFRRIAEKCAVWIVGGPPLGRRKLSSPQKFRTARKLFNRSDLQPLKTWHNTPAQPAILRVHIKPISTGLSSRSTPPFVRGLLVCHSAPQRRNLLLACQPTRPNLIRCEDFAVEVRTEVQT